MAFLREKKDEGKVTSAGSEFLCGSKTAYRIQIEVEFSSQRSI